MMNLSLSIILFYFFYVYIAGPQQWKSIGDLSWCIWAVFSVFWSDVSIYMSVRTHSFHSHQGFQNCGPQLLVQRLVYPHYSCVLVWHTMSQYQDRPPTNRYWYLCEQEMFICTYFLTISKAMDWKYDYWLDISGVCDITYYA